MSDCLFCRIPKKEIPSKAVYEDEQVYAFEDINPAAPVHVLIIPKKHISTLNDISDGDKELAGHLLFVAGKIAKEKGFAEAGYRTVFNVNKDGGQVVFHLHLHLLGGRLFKWPPE